MGALYILIQRAVNHASQIEVIRTGLQKDRKCVTTLLEKFNPTISDYSEGSARVMQPNGDYSVLAVSVVPIFYIHSFEQPFCTNPFCRCQLKRQVVIELFVQLVEGKLELEKAAELIERTVE